LVSTKEKEKQVIKLVTEGKTTREIQGRLHISKIMARLFAKWLGMITVLLKRKGTGVGWHEM
jgi:hypothetical protein